MSDINVKATGKAGKIEAAEKIERQRPPEVDLSQIRAAVKLSAEGLLKGVQNSYERGEFPANWSAALNDEAQCDYLVGFFNDLGNGYTAEKSVSPDCDGGPAFGCTLFFA